MKFFDNEGNEVKVGDLVVAVMYWPTRAVIQEIVHIRPWSGNIEYSNIFLDSPGARYDHQSSFTRPDDKGTIKRIIKQKQ